MTSRRPRVLVALRKDRVAPPGLLDVSSELADIVQVVNADEIDHTFDDVTASFVWNFRSTVIPEAIDRLPALEWVHVAASGVDASLSDQVRSRGVIVTNSRGVTSESMAEYALALMLAVAKGLALTLDLQRRHQWAPRESLMLRGRCLVLVGTGAVNRALAVKASALGMRVVGIARHAHPAGPGFERIDSVVGLPSALSEADYLVVATPLTTETRGLIGRPELALLPRNAAVLNLGRGAVFDEAALIEALRCGQIRSAALDVFNQEPLPAESPLWDLPGSIVSPHMSSDFVGWQEAMVEFFVTNLRRWLGGRELLNVVDPSLGYATAHEDLATAVPNSDDRLQ